MRARALLGVLLAGVLAVALAGPAAADGAPAAKVRVFHNSPDTPPVDVYVNDAKVLSNVPYGTLSPYLEVPRGTYLLEVKVAPSDPGDRAALSSTVRLGVRPTTVAAIGSLTGDGGKLQLLVVRDRATYAAGRARLRVAHTSPDAPAVDVQVRAGGRWVPVFGNLEFGEVSAYRLLPAGTYDFRITAAGTDKVVKRLPDVELAGRTSYTVWAVGFLTPEGDYPGFGVFVSTDGR